MTGTHAHTCVEVGRLNGEIESLRRDNLAFAAENARLRSELADTGQVVEAAKAWRRAVAETGDYEISDADVLIAAVDALPTAVNV